jgi:hypothetical protein
MDFLLFEKFEDHSQFRQYCSKLTFDQKVKYLKLLEQHYSTISGGDYKLVFRDFDIQLLMEQSTEVATRIFFLFHTYMDNKEQPQ